MLIEIRHIQKLSLGREPLIILKKLYHCLGGSFHVLLCLVPKVNNSAGYGVVIDCTHSPTRDYHLLLNHKKVAEVFVDSG